MAWVKDENWRSKGQEQRKKTTQERFYEKMDQHGYDDCWEWLGARDKDGYGIFRHNGKNLKAHRYVVNFNSPAIVMHTCDNPPCCNPAHLRVGTHGMNQRDAVRKGRAPGAKLRPAQVRSIRLLCEAGASQSDVARRYGVKPSTVNGIILGKRWSCVD